MGPEKIIQAATRIQGQATSCAGSISQKALAFALQTDAGLIDTFRQSFEKRRNRVPQGLEAIDGIRTFKPAGAFYLFADVSRLIEKIKGISDSVSFCDYLLDQWRIACIPGKVFGEDRCIRFSFVAEETTINEGLSRLSQI